MSISNVSQSVPVFFPSGIKLIILNSRSSCFINRHIKTRALALYLLFRTTVKAMPELIHTLTLLTYAAIRLTLHKVTHYVEFHDQLYIEKKKHLSQLIRDLISVANHTFVVLRNPLEIDFFHTNFSATRGLIRGPFQGSIQTPYVLGIATSVFVITAITLRTIYLNSAESRSFREKEKEPAASLVTLGIANRAIKPAALLLPPTTFLHPPYEGLGIPRDVVGKSEVGYPLTVYLKHPIKEVNKVKKALGNIQSLNISSTEKCDAINPSRPWVLYGSSFALLVSLIMAVASSLLGKPKLKRQETNPNPITSPVTPPTHEQPLPEHLPPLDAIAASDTGTSSNSTSPYQKRTLKTLKVDVTKSLSPPSDEKKAGQAPPIDSTSPFSPTEIPTPPTMSPVPLEKTGSDWSDMFTTETTITFDPTLLSPTIREGIESYEERLETPPQLGGLSEEKKLEERKKNDPRSALQTELISSPKTKTRLLKNEAAALKASLNSLQKALKDYQEIGEVNTNNAEVLARILELINETKSEIIDKLFGSRKLTSDTNLTMGEIEHLVKLKVQPFEATESTQKAKVQTPQSPLQIQSPEKQVNQALNILNKNKNQFINPTHRKYPEIPGFPNIQKKNEKTRLLTIAAWLDVLKRDIVKQNTIINKAMSASSKTVVKPEWRQPTLVRRALVETVYSLRNNVHQFKKYVDAVDQLLKKYKQVSLSQQQKIDLAKAEEGLKEALRALKEAEQVIEPPKA